MLNRIVTLSLALENERRERQVAESKVATQQWGNPEEEVIRLIRYMAEDRKIEAIKSFRTLTGHGLKESKDAVETVMFKMRAAS